MNYSPTLAPHKSGPFFFAEEFARPSAMHVRSRETAMTLRLSTMRSRRLTKMPDSLSSIQCFGALSRLRCFLGPEVGSRKGCKRDRLGRKRRRRLIRTADHLGSSHWVVQGARKRTRGKPTRNDCFLSPYTALHTRSCSSVRLASLFASFSATGQHP